MLERGDNMYKSKYNNLKTLIVLNIILTISTIWVVEPIQTQAVSSYTADVTDEVIQEAQQPYIIDSNPAEIPVKEALINQYQQEKTIEPSDPKEIINEYIRDVCRLYPNVGQALVKSVIYHESRYNPKAKNGNCLGLMQVSSYWHKGRAKRLGVTDFHDPRGNILLGVDYLSELIERYEDPALALMLYNMRHDDALKMYRTGQISKYAKSVLAKAEEYEKGE